MDRRPRVAVGRRTRAGGPARGLARLLPRSSAQRLVGSLAPRPGPAGARRISMSGSGQGIPRGRHRRIALESGRWNVLLGFPARPHRGVARRVQHWALPSQHAHHRPVAPLSGRAGREDPAPRDRSAAARQRGQRGHARRGVPRPRAIPRPHRARSARQCRDAEPAPPGTSWRARPLPAPSRMGSGRTFGPAKTSGGSAIGSSSTTTRFDGATPTTTSSLTSWRWLGAPARRRLCWTSSKAYYATWIGVHPSPARSAPFETCGRPAQCVTTWTDGG